MVIRKVKLKACGSSEPAVKPKPNKIYTDKRIYPVPKQEKKKKKDILFQTNKNWQVPLLLPNPYLVVSPLPHYFFNGQFAIPSQKQPSK